MTTQPPYRLMIVDDHPMVAEGITAILESYADLEVVGTLSNGQQAVDQIDNLSPDVVLMDLNMPGMSGLSATELLRERRPETKVVILSMHDSPEYISTAMRHGAAGYVLKDSSTEEIRQAILSVVGGTNYLCAGAQSAATPAIDASERETLTNREQAILLQLAQGQSNKEVAQELNISVRTVETHRKNIKRKLGISSTAGLTRYAMENGVLQGTSMGL